MSLDWWVHYDYQIIRRDIGGLDEQLDKGYCSVVSKSFRCVNFIIKASYIFHSLFSMVYASTYLIIYHSLYNLFFLMLARLVFVRLFVKILM